MATDATRRRETLRSIPTPREGHDHRHRHVVVRDAARPGPRRRTDLVAVQKATRDDEPGCLAYCFAADPAEPHHVQVFELWTDAASLAEHFEHPNYAAMVDVLRNCGGFLKSENRLYAADDLGPVYEDGRFCIDAVADAGG